MVIRHPREGDILPIPLEYERYDPEWVWIMGNAILIAAGAHDLVLLLRLVRFGEMDDPAWLRRLLRHVIKECRERGFHRYMTWLANDVEEEKKLLDLAHRRYGAFFEPFQGDIAAGEF
jgi:hypothetical protein